MAQNNAVLHSEVCLLQDNEHSRKINKISKCFSDSARTYKQNAQLQYDVGLNLFHKMNEGHIDVLLDLGCGPGLFSNELQQKSQTLISLDLSYNMLKTNVCESNSETKLNAKIQANSHHLPLKPHSLGAVFSSLMVQWCELPVVLQQIHQSLKHGGTAYISTLVEGSLFELEQAWSNIDSDKHIYDYLTEETVKQSVRQLDWSGISIEQTSHVYWFESALALAKELKSLGANYVERENKGLTPKSKWQNMEKAYFKAFYNTTKNAVPATYNVMYLKLTK